MDAAEGSPEEAGVPNSREKDCAVCTRHWADPWLQQDAPAYDREYLPVLSVSHPPPQLYMLESHYKDLGREDSMVMRSRSQV
jgi:hypothetical protein